MSRFDSLPIHYLVVSPQKPKAIVQIVHGMCEYKERYMKFLRYLAVHDYVAVIHDHRGHGDSVFSENDRGFFYSGGYRAMIDDINRVNELIRCEYPGLPVFIFGHSMGSMLVRSYLKRCPDRMDGLVVCGSPSYNPLVYFGKPFVRGMAIVKGRKYRSRYIQNMCFGNYTKWFKDIISPNRWLSSNPDVIREYDRDPKCNFIFTLNGFSNLFSIMIDAYSPKGWRIENAKMPIYFVSGAHDPCAISRAQFENSINRIKRIGYRKVSFFLYDNMRHEILNEKNNDFVYDDLVRLFDGWLLKIKAKNKKQ